MKLNSFGETIRRIEAERLAEAQEAIANGWTEADHPTKCCEPVIAPRRAGKTHRAIEETERLKAQAENKAKWWADALKRREQELASYEASVPKFDHGMMQVSLKTRRKGIGREMQTWRNLEHAKERSIHYQHLAKKYQDQIDKRSK